MKLVKPCERCGVMCDNSIVLSWELTGNYYGPDMPPTAEREMKNKARQLCMPCVDIIMKEYVRDNPPSAFVNCIGCNEKTVREELKVLASETGGMLLCPTCIRSYLLEHVENQ